jgi:chromosome segregation ATPase
MRMSDIISEDFARVFSRALTHPAKVTILSASSVLATAGTASAVITGSTVLGAGSILLGVTSILGWNSVYAPAYEEELRTNMRTMKGDKSLIANLQKKLKEQGAQLESLSGKITELSKDNAELQSAIKISREQIQCLQKMKVETTHTMQELQEKTTHLTEKIQKITFQKQRVEQVMRISTELGQKAMATIEGLEQSIVEKDLAIEQLNKQVEDLTEQVAELQQ